MMKRMYNVILLVLLILFVLFLIWKDEILSFFKGSISKNSTEKLRFLEGETIRNDIEGHGHFGAKRLHGSHQGLDYLRFVDEPVYMPFDGVIKRIGYPSPTRTFFLMEVAGVGKFKGFSAKIMYVNPILHPSSSVIKQGVQIAVSQDLRKKYSHNMLNHVHFELRKNGKLVDPANYM